LPAYQAAGLSAAGLSWGGIRALPEGKQLRNRRLGRSLDGSHRLG